MQKAKVIIVMLLVMLCLVSCARQTVLDQSNNNSESKNNSVYNSNNEEETEMSFDQNSWIGEYVSIVDGVNGELKIYQDEDFMFGDVDLTTPKGHLCAKLFIWEMEDCIVSLTLHEYLGGNEITDFNVSDPVIWMKKNPDGSIDSKIEIDGYNTEWLSIFQKK